MAPSTSLDDTPSTLERRKEIFTPATRSASSEGDHDLVGRPRGASELEGLERPVEGDRVADDQGVLLPVLDDVLGDLEDLGRVTHRPHQVQLGGEDVAEVERSEERRVGKECRSGGGREE